MRKVFVLMAFSPLFFACGSSDNGAADGQKEDTAKTEATKPATAANQAELDKGLEMIGALDCTTCHKISEKSIGPEYIAVAQKYEASPAIIDTLATKIIYGGTGVWGQVPMTPHPNVSMDSARTMVKYILSLRNQ
jgi:cytochrome c